MKCECAICNVFATYVPVKLLKADPELLFGISKPTNKWVPLSREEILRTYPRNCYSFSNQSKQQKSFCTSSFPFSRCRILVQPSIHSTSSAFDTSWIDTCFERRFKIIIKTDSPVPQLGQSSRHHFPCVLPRAIPGNFQAADLILKELWPFILL